MAEDIKVSLKAEKCTKDSDTIEKMKIADKHLAGKKGISFYCSKRHEFIFIENERGQSSNYAPRFQKVEIKKEEDFKKEIAPNIRTKQWQD